MLGRGPETLSELYKVITDQLGESETVTITLTDGDGIHELLGSMSDGICATKTPKGLHRFFSGLVKYIGYDSFSDYCEIYSCIGSELEEIVNWIKHSGKKV